MSRNPPRYSRTQPPRTFARAGHGQGKGRVHTENPLKDLPAAVPAAPRPAANRDPSGKMRPGAGTSELARYAAQAKHEAARLGRLLGLRDLDETHPYREYSRLARDFRDDQCRELAATVGGGKLSPGVMSIVSSAALQLGASRWMADKGALEMDPGLLLQASKLASESKQMLLAAHSLAALEAHARAEQPEAEEDVIAYTTEDTDDETKATSESTD